MAPTKPTRAAAPAKSKPKPKATLPPTIVAAIPSSASLMRQIAAAAALIPDVNKELARSKKGGSIAMARSYVALHRMVERIDDLMKPLRDTFNDYKTIHIPALFEQDGITSIPLDEGFRVGVSSKFVASIKSDERDKAYDWLRANGLGDIIQGTVNAGTLSAAAKKLLEEKNVELPSDLFNTAFLPSVSVTSTK